MTAIYMKVVSRCAGAAFAVLLLATSGAGAQQGQQDWYTLNNRISSLQDQIFRLQDKITANSTGSSAAVANINPATAAGLSLRIDSIEQQLRRLTGTIEQMANSVQRIDDRLKRFSQDAEFRFRELEGGKPAAVRRPSLPQGGGAGRPQRLLKPGGGRPTSGPVPLNRTGNIPLPSDPPRIVVPDSLGKAAPPQILGQIPANVETADLGQVQGAPGSGGNASPAPPRSDAGVAYERAYEALLRRRFDAAEAGFKGFLRQYPRHELAGNSQYWLGETYYARGRFRDAAAAFVKGYKKYKTGRKAPDSLLKLAMTLKRLGQKSEACSTLDQLDRQFPRASSAVRNRAKLERKQAGC